MKVYPLTTLTEILAPNSVGAFDFPLTIGLIHGCERLTIRSSTRCVCVQHFLLLVIEHDDRKKMVALDPEQTVQSIISSVIFEIAKVPTDTSLLIADFFPDLFYRFFSAFVELQEPPADNLPVRPGLFTFTVHGAEKLPVTVKDGFCPSPRLVT